MSAKRSARRRTIPDDLPVDGAAAGGTYADGRGADVSGSELTDMSTPQRRRRGRGTRAYGSGLQTRMCEVKRRVASVAKHSDLLCQRERHEIVALPPLVA